jgi:hypothetical protein
METSRQVGDFVQLRARRHLCHADGITQESEHLARGRGNVDPGFDHVKPSAEKVAEEGHRESFRICL